ncbi:DUF551 domain-containing protein [Enterobacter hormaechei]|uniref:DUF551 domain-containing protein n=1 Tax=Enterobacter hormaechei TaxID=158836 RepID=UPI003CC55140
MSTITKEFTKEQLQQIIETDHVQCGEASALARIALASLEAEAVAWLLSGGGAKNHVSFDSGNAYADPLREVTPLYTAPPAPVDNIHPLLEFAREYIESWDLGMAGDSSLLASAKQAIADSSAQQLAPVSVPAAMEMDDDFDSAFEHGKAVGWNAYRAAMLQSFGNSEQLNYPVIQDGWVACSERMPEESGRYWCYVEEQNDLGKSHYQWNCSWNGDRWWVESENGGRVTHWMPLPAAPQQEDRIQCCRTHPQTALQVHPFEMLMSLPPKQKMYCPECEPGVAERIDMMKNISSPKVGE